MSVTEKIGVMTITLKEVDYIVKAIGINVKLETLIQFAEGIKALENK